MTTTKKIDTRSWRFDEPDFYLGDPVPVYHWLHEHDPVHWYEEGGFWVVTRHADIRFISSTPAEFSSQKIGVIMDLIRRRKGEEQIGVPAEGIEATDGRSRGLMFMDPPEHNKHRKLVAPRLTRRGIGKYDAVVGRIAAELVDALPLGEPLDFMTAVAEPFPVWVFAELLGVPQGDWPDIVRWSTAIAAVGSGDDADTHMDTMANEIAPYLMTLLADRQQNPRDDLLSVIAHASVDGEPYDLVQQLTMAVVLLAAGSETTQSLISGMVQSLLLNPGEQQRLFQNPGLLGGAVEETLRWWTPVRSMARESVQPVTLGGSDISAGDGLLLLYSAGNRDRDFWGESVDTFDITRPDPSRHLGFGFGEHFCMGVHLARRETRALFTELLGKVSRIEATGPATPRRSTLIAGFDSLPVVLAPR